MERAGSDPSFIHFQQLKHLHQYGYSDILTSVAALLVGVHSSVQF